MAKKETEAGGGIMGDVKTPTPRELPLAIDPGTVLAGNYEVAERIGEGGMAIVYKARQTSLGRNVGIKALHPRFAQDAEFINRFEAESGALAALSHPNIINIIDRGSDGTIYFFVMELVDGETLDQKIIDNKLTPNDWRSVVAACKDAFDYVHKRGIVHRDIKPSNILISNEGRIKIGDFGIAHILAGDGEIPAYSGPNRAVGTAHYMAPEQTSNPGTVNHKADIYSLAVTFYKMLTRQLPIGEYPAPSEANHEVPVAVDQVIFQAMAPDPDDRFKSVAEFCDALLKALREQSMSITSILNYRGPTTSSLYSGADFSKKAPGSGEFKKPDSGQFKPMRTPVPSKPVTRADRRSSSAAVRKPALDAASEGGRVTASKDLTPLPVPVDAGPPPRQRKSSPIIYLLVALLAIAGLTIIIMAVAMFQQPPESAPVSDQNLAPLTDSVSPARERERRAEELRRQQQEQLLNNDGGAAE